MSKVVIAYASNYWKPGENPKDGIGLVAKSNYESVVAAFPNDDAIYIDAMDYNKIRGVRDVSALFSISSTIDKLQKICNPEISTLITVNESALLRRTIKDRARCSGFSKKYLTGHDGIYSNLNETKNVDFILGFGAWSLFQSYTEIGIDPAKVFPIGWHYWNTFSDKPKKEFGNKIVAYLGAICYRKGIEKIFDVVFFLVENHPSYKLELAGFVWNKYLEQELKDLAFRFPDNFVWKNERIEYGKENWFALEVGSCFAIFPSFEEGLSGCAMDVINLGIPLFHSAKTGIEPSHISIRNLDFESDDWPDVLDEVIKKGPELWSAVALEQRKAAFHQNPNNDSLSRAVQRISNGHIWPKVDTSALTSGYLDLKGQKFVDSIRCKTNPDYIISTDFSSSQNVVNVNYRDLNSMRALESLQMAIYLAEKYNNFSSISFGKESGAAFDINVLRTSQSGPSSEVINLYMCSYSNKYLSNGGSLRYLKLRESISSRIFAIRYRVTRNLNIIRLKLRLILKAHFFKDRS
jgi:hypothetical protein